MSKFTGIVLAAGKGTRMRSKCPKVLHEIAGRPMVNYVVETLSRLHPREIITVIAPGMDEVRQAILAQNKKVKFAVQKEQLGTGHAVTAALPKLKGNDGDVVILYGDCPFISGETIGNMLNALNAEENTAIVVLGFTPYDPAEYGRLVMNVRSELQAIVEYKDADSAIRAITLCNSGVMAVKGTLLPKLLRKLKNLNSSGEFYLTDLVAIANFEGLSCHVVRAEEEEVMGINSREQLAAAENIMQRKLRVAALGIGVTLIAPETVFFSADTILSKDAIIHPFVVIGKGTAIDEGVEIRSFSHIEGARIGKNAIIGPFARLRPGADLAGDVHIGNFVEIKKSKIGKGSKIGHLSYVGDSTLGSMVNIGAGSVTCNYDGKNKYETKIGSGAFIGSNTSLVAPVSIGEGAVIGAGSTIVKNVKKGTKVINVMPQKEL